MFAEIKSLITITFPEHQTVKSFTDNRKLELIWQQEKSVLADFPVLSGGLTRQLNAL